MPENRNIYVRKFILPCSGIILILLLVCISYTVWGFRSSDLNQDNIVNQADFNIMISSWNSAAKPKADINQDGIVNSVDLGILMSQYGSTTFVYNYDIVVVGAGTGGVSAAIQAARLGAKVALLEETDWVGGQMNAAGVTSMDEYQTNSNSGIYKEFTDKIKSYYGDRPVSTCYGGVDNICFEPKVGQQVLKAMISQEAPNITLYLRTKVASVLKSGNIVTGVILQDGNMINSKIVIDATEYGDVIPLTGARYRVGNSISSSINPNACVQDITYLAVMKKYPSGVPSELWMNNPPPGYTQEVVNGFKTYVTKDGGLLWDPFPWSWAEHNGYRGMPDSSNPDKYDSSDKRRITKTGINFANDFHYYVSSLDRSNRKQDNCEAKLKTLQFVYYVQHELGETLWSVANDEGYDTAYNIQENSCENIPPEFKSIEKHFPVMPYVREARRIIGLHTLTAPEIKREQNWTLFPSNPSKFFSSSVAIGDYGVDLHGCNGANTIEYGLEDMSYVPRAGYDGGVGYFQVPFESLIPETVNGFLAAEKGISQSRLANGATRLQPITMLTGQAAGAIAALAIKKNIQPRQLNPVLAQDELLKGNDKLSIYKFWDVPQGHSSWQYVELASLYGIMVGKDNIPFETHSGQEFEVNGSLSRQDAAVVITRQFKISTANVPSTPTFSDVPISNPAFASIEALYREGITGGCQQSPLMYCPQSVILRSELAIMWVRAMKINISTASPNQIFEDVPPSHWAFPYIQILAQKGIITGCSQSPKRFCPDDAVTRGAVAVFVANTLISQTGY